MNKKDELLTNAARIINQEGIQKLTIDYLAKTSKITKGGVLYHFENKANLLLQMNEMVIQKFEDVWDHYKLQLSGASLITRAYALATLDFLKSPETALLPAVFISSLEDAESYKLWQKTSEIWEQRFQSDNGDEKDNLKLRLICDGIWFSILYVSDNALNKQMESLVLEYCHTLEKENI